MSFLPEFPHAIRRVASRVLSLLSAGSYPGSPHFDVQVAGERLCVPDRLDSNPATLQLLCAVSENDAWLLAACLGTRHADGHVREACLRRLQGSQQAWVNPFVVNLLGDYVIEIAELAASLVPSLDPDSLARLAHGNPAFFALARSRAVSYWDAFYRYRYRDYRDYPPVAVLDSITTAAVGRVAPTG